MTARENRVHLKAGDIVIAQDEAGHAAYVIESGRVEIMQTSANGETQHLGTRGPGTMVGEMAIIDHGPRSATVRAVEDSVLLEITREDFTRRLGDADPILQMAMHTVLTRFRDLMRRSRILHDLPPFPTAEELERDAIRQPDAIEAIRIANEFGAALHAGEIALHYQPIVNLADGRPVGFESLMRWDRPSKGPLSPSVFIPVIEDSGQIIEASDWVLSEALAALRRIDTGSGRPGDLFMSVNLSAREFTDDHFIDRLLRTVQASGVVPTRIHLEITERLLMVSPEAASAALARCRQAGLHIAIDDFGTGYSSLSYLHAFPIDTLKVDRVFVKDMLRNRNSMELIRSIVALGKNLDMDLIAEGIESAEEAAALRDMGCDMGQGYFFARPMPEDQATTFARENRTVNF